MKINLNKMRQEAITNKRFNEILQEEVDNHIQFFADKKQDGFMPQLSVYLKSNDNDELSMALMVIVGDGGFDTFEERSKLIYETGKRVHAEFTKKQGLCPVAVFMSSEAWMKTLKKGEKQNPDYYVHDYPDKKEVIITCGLTVDMRTNVAFQDMIRDEKRIVTLEEPMIQKYGSKGKGVESPMLANFFKGWFIASQGTEVLN